MLLKFMPKITFYRELTFYYQIISSFFLVYIFNQKVNLCSSFEKCYSSNVTYALQVDSFISGKLSLAETPMHFLYDWAWGQNGLYQLWGLGVPALRVPFELISRYFFNFNYFPDRLIILFYTFTVICISINVFSQLIQVIFSISKLNSITYSLFLNYCFYLSSPIINMLSYRTYVYEEAVFFNFLFCSLLFLLVLLFFVKDNIKVLYLFSILSGFASFIRPTGFIYAVVLLIITSFYLLNKRRVKAIILIFMLFSIGISLNLYLNYLRFGSFFEFGYSLNLSNISLNNYNLRFTNPYLSTSLLSAAMELFSALFIVLKISDDITFNSKILFFQDNNLRFREFSFETFNNLYMYAFMLSLVFSIYYLLLLFKKEFKTNKVLLFLSSFSLISFFGLSAFYIYSPTIISRYMIDYLLAINVSIIALAFFVIDKFLKKFKVY